MVKATMLLEDLLYLASVPKESIPEAGKGSESKRREVTGKPMEAFGFTLSETEASAEF